MNTNDRIIDTVPHGQHIVLTCRQHPNKRWSTKNIAPIGCRTLFYDLHRNSEGPECTCPMSDLIPLEPQP